MMDSAHLPEAGKLAVLAPNWLGDAVMCEPLIRALGRHRPNCRITLHGRPAALAALRGHPALDEAIVMDDRGLRGPWTAGRALAREHPDAVLLLRGSFRSALVARLAGAPHRIGIDRDGRGFLLTQRVPWQLDGPPRPTVDLYAALGEAVGVPVEDRLPRLDVTTEERSRAASMLQDLPRPIVGVVPGGSKLAKRWPRERFVETADRLGGVAGSVVLLGGPDERELLASIERACDGTIPVRDLAATGLGLESLRGVVEACDVLVTNDTGPRHLAVGTGVPTIVLFGPTDHRWTILPGADERLLLAEPFLDDRHIADRHPEACRIDRIPVDDVVHAVADLLTDGPVSSSS